MWMLALAIAATLATGADEPGPAELVRLLGSADRAERAEAAISLEELGTPALAALGEAEKSATAEVRSRISTITRTIEGRRLGEPTLVSLDLDGVPLEKAVQTLAERSGHRIQIEAEKDAGWTRRSVSVSASGKIPFWEALDRLGQAGHVRNDPSIDSWKPAKAATIRLIDGDPPSWTLYRGAFRVHLASLHWQRDLDLGEFANRKPERVGVFSLSLQAFAEPGRFLDPDGTPKVEIEDDGGRTVPPPDEKTPGQPNFSSRSEIPGTIAIAQWSMKMGLPDPKAKTLRRVRRTLPVVVSAPRGEPIVVPMAEAASRTLRRGDFTLRFPTQGEAQRPGFLRGPSPRNASGSWQFDVILGRDPAPSTGRDDRAWVCASHRVGFEDADGQPISWQLLQESAESGNERRLQVWITGQRPPARLRLDDLAWSSQEIPFAFVDVPLP